DRTEQGPPHVLPGIRRSMSEPGRGAARSPASGGTMSEPGRGAARSPASGTMIDLGRRVGPAHRPFIIAELSANHLGSLERALQIVDAAADAGCDALKLQTFTPESMTLDSARGDFHIADGPWQGRSLWDLYDEAHTPWDWHARLFEHGASR